MTDPLPAGIYESLRTVGLERALASVDELEPRFAAVEPADAPEVLARHVAQAVRRLLADGSDADRRAAVINELMDTLRAPDERLADGLEQLIALTRAVATGTDEVLRPGHPAVIGGAADQRAR